MWKSDTPEYRAWSAMKQRCTNKNDPKYSSYGGRGIKVCDRWLGSFDAFLEDMGQRPTSKHSLDRYPDNNGGYEPSNCRWATIGQQLRNTRRNVVVVSMSGKPLSLTDAASSAGVSLSTLRGRRASGLPLYVEPGSLLRKGESHYAAKLTAADVALVRLRLSAGETQASIASDFGVERTTISAIKTGATWRSS